MSVLGRTASRARGNRGFSYIELVVVMLLMGTMAAVTVPRALRSTPMADVDRTARQLARDMEQVRMRAMASKRTVRVTFDQSSGFYAAFMDISTLRTGTFSETVAEARQARLLARGSKGGIPGVLLPKRVKFGTGSVSGLGPLEDAISGAIGLAGNKVDFDARGMATPVGTKGTIYITHENDPSAVAAITISGAGSFQAWRYRDGSWQR